MANELLLPSQETLIQRLLHLACYGQQLVLLSGANGSGKTSVLAGLADELDTRNLALVSCPQHVAAQEIRRKIIMQLLPDPLFDDEVSLVDTLLRFVSTLNKPLHILLDDAEHLPLAVWAELLLVTEIQCAGYPITVTATVSTEFAEGFSHQLPARLRNVLLPIVILPLSLAEREGLYQTLLTRSKQSTFTPRSIIVPQLQRQTGTPAEVVELIELALNETPVVKMQRAWGKYFAAGALAVFMMGCLAWYGYKASVPLPEVTLASPVLAATNVDMIEFAKAIIEPSDSESDIPAAALHGLTLLSITDFADVSGVTSQDEFSSPQNEFAANLPSHDDADVSSELLQDALNVAGVETSTIRPPQARKVELLSVAAKPASHPTKRPVAQSDAQSSTQSSVISASAVDAPKAAATKLPMKGFTLQVASVKHRDSLAPVLEKLKGQPITICRHRDWWVVLVGDFAERATASQISQQLTAKGFSKPWLRAWKELGDYQLEKRISDEISS
ncbi:AAA family ATPase [Shewanella avicenniae]|uniref:AAA family ATPase n=1 Tax=Shewanella avicenniae TaxID=2814294 RepID=A0ABX7QS07_9GAMM|nr:AAA family ATPase [Shewanella avicenniae]QSX34039.1 AAA family ATPase [Shewanella avicenniae]